MRRALRIAAVIAAVVAALLCAGCSAPAPRGDAEREPSPAAPKRDEAIVVLEAPAGSGMRRERPAILRVVDWHTGRGIAEAEVEGPGATERTDTDGFCELPRDEGDARAWIVTAEGYAPAVANGIGAGAVVRLSPGTALRVRIVDTLDRPVTGARVALVGWLKTTSHRASGARPPDFELHRTTTGLKGWGEFAAVTGREYVRASAARHLTAEIAIEAMVAGPDGFVLRLRQWPGGEFAPQSPQEPAGMEIQVRDASTLAPVAGLPLRLESFETDGALFAARTGPDGIARVRCPAGEYGCEPQSPFASHSFERVHVDASTDRRRFLVRVVPNPTVAAEVQGLPAETMLTYAVSGAQRESRVGVPVAVRPGLPLVVSVAARGADNAWSVDALARNETHRSVQLTWRAHTATRPRAAAPAGRPPESEVGVLLVDVRDAKGRFCSGRVSLDGRWSGRGSRITLPRVDAGPHRVVVWADGREVLVQPVTVVAGERVRLLVRLRRLDE